jgi:PPK2 family polyphosphate:nucleotide phosphotransferase
VLTLFVGPSVHRIEEVSAHVTQRQALARARKLARVYRITDGRTFRLKDVDPGDTGDITSKQQAEGWLERGIGRLRRLQEKMYAQNRWSLLLIFQAMDAAGKDGTIKHVMSGINPQGCQVFSFKQPSAEDLDHDFLWRTTRCLPERGRIGIFNRSYYEEVLVVRVHPEILDKQRLPPALVTKHIWEERFTDINAFERYATRNGVAIRKFFLHVSRGEQKRRFMRRLEEPRRNWKFSLGDAQERNHWTDYMRAYQDMIRRTSSPHAPWHVVPADNKWFTRLVVGATVIDAMEEMALAFPRVDDAKRKELAAAHAALGGKRRARDRATRRIA